MKRMGPIAANLGAFLSIVVLAMPAAAAVRLPAIFSDHAILQAGRPIAVWGWADPGQKIAVTFRGSGVTGQFAATTGADSRWRGNLPALPAGTSGSLDVSTDGTVSRTVSDVLIGEVWLCGGQSNMSYRVLTTGMTPNQNTTPALLAQAQHEATEAAGQLRYFDVNTTCSDVPLDDVAGRWVVAAPNTVGNCFALSWNFGVALREKLQCPIGLVDSAVGGTAAESWTPRPELDACKAGPSVEQRYAVRFRLDQGDSGDKYRAQLAAWAQANPTPDLQMKNLAGQGMVNPGQGNYPARLYNGMINGLAPYTLKGVIWFQGDGNGSHPEEYASLIKTLILAWRGKFQQELPFYYVEMQNYNAPPTQPVQENGLSPIREAQQAALELHATDVAASFDLGIRIPNYEAHFPDKKPLGQRLAGLALYHLYGVGQPDQVHSPCLASYSVAGHTIILRFDYAQGLRVRGGGQLQSFAIRAAGGKWVWAQGRIDGQDIVLWSDVVPVPEAVRYAWANNPVASVENAAGLPLRPFRTDIAKD